MAAGQDSLILPNSFFALFWAIAFPLLIILYFSSALFEICFIRATNQLLNTTAATIVILIFCLFDTIIFINTGIAQQGKLIKSRKRNLKNYLYSFFFIFDLVLTTSLIVRIILGAINQSKYALVLSILDLVTFVKFYNIAIYEKTLKFYYFSDWSLLIFEFFKYLILLTFLCHIVGCIYFLIDALMIEAAWYPIQEHWLISCSAMPYLYSEPVGIQYLYSFYFSIVTLSSVAYGDITPLNPTETSFVVFVLAFLLGFYAYIFAQIYEVVNWFNRKPNQIQENKHKIADFLKAHKISTQLSGKILSQYQFREKQNTQTNKDLFIHQIPTKLLQNYNSVPYKCQVSTLIPRFIKKLEIQSQNFYQLISETFVVPQEQFSPLQFLENRLVERKMYFVGQKQVQRILSTGTSQLKQLAEINRWLGINTFLTCQYDDNQKWRVQTPHALISLKFTDLQNYLKDLKKVYEKFMEESHRNTFFTEISQDMNKCLICWKNYHNSRYCMQYRPEITHKASKKERRYSKFSIAKEKIKEARNHRQKIKRLYKTHIKIIKRQFLVMRLSQSGTQIDKQFYLQKAHSLTKIQQVVWEWQNYMKQFNIPRYQNLVGAVETELMKKLTQQIPIFIEQNKNNH